MPALRKPSSKLCQRKRRLRFETLEDRRLLAAAYAEFLDPNPAPGNAFGAAVVPLSTGNVVITAPLDDAGGEDAGAVYLFNGKTGKLISTLIGLSEDTRIGSDGVTALTNGNFVVVSPGWYTGTTRGLGAVTFGNGVTGVSGAVSASNSLVGTTEGDLVGLGGVTPLSNGNYVVSSYFWKNNGVVDAGAATWGSGVTGVKGPLSATNSLVGTRAADSVGLSITALKNGNYLVGSPAWNSATAMAAGAVTFGNGATGISGVITASNSLVGTFDQDFIGGSGITELTNGNYVVASPSYQALGLGEDPAGAVTFGNGTTGVNGRVDFANSLVGAPSDYVGGGGIEALTNGNYVVISSIWSDNGTKPFAGAVTLGNGVTGTTGVVDATNSLVGGNAVDQVGNGGVTVLTNGNFVVVSPEADVSGNMLRSGAVTFVNGTTGRTGAVSAANSLVGTADADRVGSGGVTALTNGNYVVSSPAWTSGAGAVTFASGVTGISGGITAANSLVGSAPTHAVGNGGVTALTNGNYVAVSSLWDSGTIPDVGAVTFGNGTTGRTGAVSAANSLVGTVMNDLVGFSYGSNPTVIPLPNGNYVVASQAWHTGMGAATFASGTTGISGPITSSNSLVGRAENDYVGIGVTALTNGNYVVSSTQWSSETAAGVGAVTFGNGGTGVSGQITATNSLIGSNEGDHVGSGGITALSNGNYVVTNSAWRYGTLIGAGAITFGSGLTGISGAITTATSSVGSTADAGLVEFSIVDDVNRYFYGRFSSGNSRVVVGSQLEGFRFRWHNANRPLDVNHDLNIAANDALAIINYINADLPTAVDPDAVNGTPFGFLDTTGDDNVAPGDALAIINAINAGLGGPTGEGEAEGEGQEPAARSQVSGESLVCLEELYSLLAMDWVADGIVHGQKPASRNICECWLVQH